MQKEETRDGSKYTMNWQFEIQITYHHMKMYKGKFWVQARKIPLNNTQSHTKNTK